MEAIDAQYIYDLVYNSVYSGIKSGTDKLLLNLFPTNLPWRDAEIEKNSNEYAALITNNVAWGVAQAFIYVITNLSFKGKVITVGSPTTQTANIVMAVAAIHS